MTCHFFVCDWGAKVVRNPVCNCTSWEFRRLRNESKVPDDQTVNRLLAAAQLKSPCAGSHLIRTLVLAAESLCGIFSSPVIRTVVLSCHIRTVAPAVIFCGRLSFSHNMDRHVLDHMDRHVNLKCKSWCCGQPSLDQASFTVSKTVPKLIWLQAKPALVKHAEKTKTSLIKSAPDWHIYGDTQACIHIVEDEVAWKVCDVNWKVTGFTKRDQKIQQILFEQTNRALHVQMSDSWHRANIQRKKTGWFFFKVLSYADHSCTPQNHRCVQFVHRVGELIHKAIFDYGHKCAEWWIKKPRLKRWNSSLFFCLCWPANSGKMSETNQIWFVKVSPLKASVWRWIRRGEIFVLTNKYLIAVLFQGISCGGVKDTSVQIFKARVRRDAVKEVRRGWSFVLGKQLSLLSLPHPPIHLHLSSTFQTDLLKMLLLECKPKIWHILYFVKCMIYTDIFCQMYNIYRYILSNV